MKLHLWTTPNGYKPLIMLEEIGADFEQKIKVPLDQIWVLHPKKTRFVFQS